MRELEIEGKSVTVAVENGLKELGLRRDQVEVQVLAEGSSGFLGIGAKPAKVLLREKHWADPASGPSEPPLARPASKSAPAPKRSRPREEHRERPAAANGHAQAAPEAHRAERPAEDAPVDTAKARETAEGVLREILTLMGISDASIKTGWDAEQWRVRAEVECADAGLLVGKGGKTLDSLQFLTTVITGRRMKVPVAVQVDSQGHWRQIEEKIVSEIEKAVSEVKATGRAFKLEPMEPAMRRLVHRKLTRHPEIETSSEGEGSWRKVVLRPRAKGS